MKRNNHMKYPVLEGSYETSQLVAILDRVHDPEIAKVRAEFFRAENAYFRRYIGKSKVIAVGCGLGHEMFELAAYNERVYGIDINKGLVIEANRRFLLAGIQNVVADDFDLFWLKHTSNPDSYAHAVLNMGTIGNFDDERQTDAIVNMQSVARHVHFSFYQITPEAIELRKRMYDEEGWTNVRFDQGKNAFVSDEGLYSRVNSLDDMHQRVLEADPHNVFQVHTLGEFGLMARVYKEG